MYKTEKINTFKTDFYSIFDYLEKICDIDESFIQFYYLNQLRSLNDNAFNSKLPERRYFLSYNDIKQNLYRYTDKIIIKSRDNYFFFLILFVRYYTIYIIRTLK